MTEAPITMTVVLDGPNDEVRLISALEQVMRSFQCLELVYEDSCGRVRAADWIYAKYGSGNRGNFSTQDAKDG